MFRNYGTILCLFWLWPVEAIHGGDALPKLRRNGAEVFYADVDLRAALSKADRALLPEVRRKRAKITDPTFLWTKLLPRDFVLRQADAAICWAFASVTAFEYNWVIRNGGRTPLLAVQPIIDRTGKWAGAPADLALQELLDHGICLASNYPHVGQPGKPRTKAPMRYRAITWGRVFGNSGIDPTVEELKQALLDHGPLVAHVTLTPAFHAYKGGVFHDDSPLPKDSNSSHAVVIVGWDDTKAKGGCWRIENSWGEKWGELGFMWIAHGSNEIGRVAYWVQAQAVLYQLPSDIHKRVSPDTDPFPKGSNARKVTMKPPDLPVLSPAEALKRQGERVVVQFRVRGGSLPARAGDIKLYSEKSWQVEGNLIVRILKSEMDKFSPKNDRELLERYLGKEIRVRGSVQMNWIKVEDKSMNTPMIEIGDPEQIEIVK
jgi:hypothetical protein